MKKYWDNWTKTELLSLPVREWNNKGKYKSVLFVNTRKKHDSGYNLFAVIGCNRKGEPIEICGYMDDFRFGNLQGVGKCIIPDFLLAVDCSMKGVFRLHADGDYIINVGWNTSTTDWWLEEE